MGLRIACLKKNQNAPRPSEVDLHFSAIFDSNELGGNVYRPVLDRYSHEGEDGRNLMRLMTYPEGLDKSAPSQITYYFYKVDHRPGLVCSELVFRVTFGSVDDTRGFWISDTVRG